jgi:hypothetical protein
MVRAPALLAVVLGVTAAGCGGPVVDVTQGLEILDVRTGWFDAGIVDGKNKLVPSMTFKLRNVSDQPLVALRVNALFRRAGEADEWGSSFLTVAGSEGLSPGVTSDDIVARSALGYTGTEPRQEMLKNAHFVDATVEVFAKYGSQQWKLVGKHAVARELLTP